MLILVSFKDIIYDDKLLYDNNAIPFMTLDNKRYPLAQWLIKLYMIDLCPKFPSSYFRGPDISSDKSRYKIIVTLLHEYFISQDKASIPSV